MDVEHEKYFVRATPTAFSITAFGLKASVRDSQAKTYEAVLPMFPIVGEDDDWNMWVTSEEVAKLFRAVLRSLCKGAIYLADCS